jgi:hypothetical protein
MRLALDTFGRKLIGRWVLISVRAHDEIMPSSVPGGNIDSINPAIAMPVKKDVLSISTSGSLSICAFLCRLSQLQSRSLITIGVIFDA